MMLTKLHIDVQELVYHEVTCILHEHHNNRPTRLVNTVNELVLAIICDLSD